MTLILIFVDDERMTEEHVAEEMISSWAAEAEAGYNTTRLKRRGHGRQGNGAESMQVVAV